MPEPHADWDQRVIYHPSSAAAVVLHEKTRASIVELGHQLIDDLPPGRHQSLALTALQETLLWANAAIACDLKDEAI